MYQRVRGSSALVWHGNDREKGREAAGKLYESAVDKTRE